MDDGIVYRPNPNSDLCELCFIHQYTIDNGPFFAHEISLMWPHLDGALAALAILKIRI